MEGHEHIVVKPFSVCFVVTSDSVAHGSKADEVKSIAESLNARCPDAMLKGYNVVENVIEKIRLLVSEYVSKCDVVIVTGGTGLSSRDVSIEAVEPLASKHLPGFGELFRALSYNQVGIRAYLSRATAYVVERSLVFIVPGNPKAVELAVKDIICKLAPHALYEVRR